MEPLGVAEFVFTDISRDGMLQGPNLASVREFADSTKLPVIASGGVVSLQDISNLLALASHGVRGILTGNALYDKNISFREARQLVEQDAG